MQYTTHIKKTYIAPEMEIVEYGSDGLMNGASVFAPDQPGHKWGDEESKGLDQGFFTPIFEDDIDRELKALRAEENKHYIY